MNKPNPSLQRKSASRMAAVQSLYKNEMRKELPTAAQQAAFIKKQLEGDKEEQKLLVGVPLEPNYGLLETILEGVQENGDIINKWIDEVLDEDWSRERTSAVLLAILQCAIFEIFFAKKKTKSGIIIDEYAHIARSFHDEKEVDFIFGALSSLVKTYE